MIGHAVALQTRPNRRVWLAKRRRGITATDVPAILGLSPWATPVTVWLDKTGHSAPVEPSYAMQRGNALEALLLAEYHRATGNPLLPVPVLAGHPEDALALASLDGATQTPDGPAILEIKTAGWRERDDWWDETKQVPDQYLAQVAWQQYVAGIDTAFIVVDVAGDVRTIGPIPRSPDFEAYAAPLMHDWWKRHVIGGEPPDPDPVRDYQAMNLLWRPDPDQAATIDPEAMQWCLSYTAAARIRADAEATQKELRGQIRARMTHATALIDNDGNRWARLSKSGALTIKPPKEKEQQ